MVQHSLFQGGERNIQETSFRQKLEGGAVYIRGEGFFQGSLRDTTLQLPALLLWNGGSGRSRSVSKGSPKVRVPKEDGL